jgi:uncharacterized protein
MFTFDLGELTTNLIALPAKHRIAFASSCCELLPNYRAFSLMENWGDVHILEQSLDVVWQFLSGVEVKRGQIHNLKEQCEKVIPDTEVSSSLFTSAALDAASAVYETLTCCLNAGAERVAVWAVWHGILSICLFKFMMDWTILIQILSKNLGASTYD